ncbi:MAG: class I SAM-dependent methyltransferase [Candidatus Hydrogenedentota bacterium]|nr:MAG: class I SAM-dependent methyltransferase [Candidatus Hydrogenedentota bacterium]
MDSTAFWDGRARKLGHTGWADFATYCYDQCLRLKAIDKVLKDQKRHFRCALDFGCGTGDFSRLLARCSDFVIAVDIAEEVIRIARTRKMSSAITFTRFSSDVFENTFDVILSVTVLQHIVDEKEWKMIIDSMVNSLEEEGLLILLETFGSMTEPQEETVLRPLNVFLERVGSKGMTLLFQSNFHHPEIVPTKAFRWFRRAFPIRLLNRVYEQGSTAAGLVLSIISFGISAFDDGLMAKESPTKVLVLKKTKKRGES